jgi:hypothetical protein
MALLHIKPIMTDKRWSLHRQRCNTEKSQYRNNSYVVSEKESKNLTIVIVLWDHLLQDKHYFNINFLRHTNKVGRYLHTLMQMQFTGQVGKHLSSLSQPPPAEHNQVSKFQF